MNGPPMIGSGDLVLLLDIAFLGIVIGLAVGATFVLHRMFRVTRWRLAAAAIVTTQVIVAAVFGIILWSISDRPLNAESRMGFELAILYLSVGWLLSLVVALPAVLVTAARLQRKSKDGLDVE